MAFVFYRFTPVPDSVLQSAILTGAGGAKLSAKEQVLGASVLSFATSVELSCAMTCKCRCLARISWLFFFV